MYGLKTYLITSLCLLSELLVDNAEPVLLDAGGLPGPHQHQDAGVVRKRGARWQARDLNKSNPWGG